MCLCRIDPAFRQRHDFSDGQQQVWIGIDANTVRGCLPIGDGSCAIDPAELTKNNRRNVACGVEPGVILKQYRLAPLARDCAVDGRQHAVARGKLSLPGGEVGSRPARDGAFSGGVNLRHHPRGLITYRIATGAQAGRKVVTLQTLPGDAGLLEGDAGNVGGFSLNAGVAAEAHESQKLEKLCRYITRPAISEKRQSISPEGRVRYQLKTPWRNGTTHVECDAVDFIAKLAALVPPPRAPLTRFHGVFAPNASLRSQLTPSGRGKRLDQLRRCVPGALLEANAAIVRDLDGYD